MNKSESIAELASALAKAQKSMDGAKADADNPFFKSKYADLSSVWKACKDHLADNGLSIVQTTRIPEDNGVIIETTLMHTSGEWVAGELKMIPVKDGPQAMGSVITYARRYALAAMVGVCPEDDDCEGAEERDKKKREELEKKKKEEALKKKAETKKDTSKQPTQEDIKYFNAMTEQKGRVGKEIYYEVLKSRGLEHCNEVSEREVRKALYAALAAS